MNKEFSSAMFLALTSMLMGSSSEFPIGDIYLSNGVTRKHESWEKVHLSKKERKGKTYAEIQALRQKTK